MIHIATVHHLSDKWIDIQLKYINKYIKSPYRIYAFLNGIKKDHSEKFYFSIKDNIKPHAEKLNILANKICEIAHNDDLIMFLDGDAFPIQEMDDFLNQKLQQFPILAVKRNIDFGDLNPHPSFCVCKVSFWKEINGDWSKGYCWKNEITNRSLTDVGGNLLKILIDKNISWFPMIRTNQLNVHPQWFAIYGNLIYHHRAGFRQPISKIDTHLIESKFTWIDQILSRIILVRRLLYSKMYRDNIKLSEQTFNLIEKDFNFCENLGLINKKVD